jgi:hypothetical protein
VGRDGPDERIIAQHAVEPLVCGHDSLCG